eukprot:scaffold4948_cov64-Phaeocystis_antarctica.AAC.3
MHTPRTYTMHTPPYGHLEAEGPVILIDEDDAVDERYEEGVEAVDDGDHYEDEGVDQHQVDADEVDGAHVDGARIDGEEEQQRRGGCLLVQLVDDVPVVPHVQAAHEARDAVGGQHGDGEVCVDAHWRPHDARVPHDETEQVLQQVVYEDGGCEVESRARHCPDEGAHIGPLVVGPKELLPPTLRDELHGIG